MQEHKFNLKERVFAILSGERLSCSRVEQIHSTVSGIKYVLEKDGRLVREDRLFHTFEEAVEKFKEIHYPLWETEETEQ